MPLAAALLAQTSPNLSVAPVPTVKVRKGAVAAVTLRAVLPPGFHANSNTPSDEYLIPLTLKWTGGPLQTDGITYPKGSLEKYPFSAKPLSVVTGEFSISTKFKVPADAPNGAAAQNGVLKYQACNDRMCFAPKTVSVSLTLEIE
jgi:thiol:disulfide interchange protein DsbD